MPTANTPWTDELVERLRALVEQGNRSATEIGTEFGFTRNAVIGKVNRLGLKLRGDGGAWRDDPLHVSRRDRQRAGKVRKAIEMNQGVLASENEMRFEKRLIDNHRNKDRRKGGTKAPVFITPVAIDPLNLTMDQLSLPEFPVQCRYVCNDDMSAPLYCGHSTHNNSSWCAFHYSRVFVSRDTAAKERAEWLARRPSMKRAHNDKLRAA